jgi:branched-chain amino acid transport system substrate-binding protein
MRPNFMAVAAYDGMGLVYKALEKTKGDASGDALLAAMKGMSWMSPRGPVSIDPETRDIVQNIYVRKVEKKDGALLQCRVRDHPQREGPVQGRQALNVGSAARR